jgi:hypothetical protein
LFVHEAFTISFAWLDAKTVLDLSQYMYVNFTWIVDGEAE